MIINDLFNNKKQGMAEGFSLKKTNVDKYMEPGDPDEYTQDVNIKDTDYEIINNKTGQVVGTASWTTNDFMGPGALKITMRNGATRWLDIWASEQGNPQSAFNRFVKDPKTAKKYKEQGMAEGSKMARADKSAKAPKPEDQQEYDAVEKYRKDLAQSYNKEPNFGIKDDEEENKWWIDYDLDEGVAEGSAKDRQWSNKDMERLRRAETELDDIFGTPDDSWTKTKQSQIKKRIQTNPIAGPKGVLPEQGMAEASLGDYRKKAAVSQAGAKIDRFFGRDDAAKVAAADQTIAKREKGLARADARIKPYTPPSAAPADLEKQQRDLTAKYPNIDELVRKAELNRDPDYEMADGQAYYAARDAEQNYQKLRQIQRVIQGLNESLNRSHLP